MFFPPLFSVSLLYTMLFRIWLMNFDIYFRVAEKKDKSISKIIAFLHLNVNSRHFLSEIFLKKRGCEKLAFFTAP